DGGSIRSWFLLPGACPRFDYAALQIHAPDAQVPDVADQQPPLRVEGDAVRLAKQRFHRRPTIAFETGDTRTGDGSDRLSARVHAAHHVILHLAEIHVALAVEAHFVGLIKSRLERGPAIARISLLSTACDGRNAPGFEIEAAHAVVADLAEV